MTEVCRACGWGTLTPEQFSGQTQDYAGDHECQKCQRICVIRCAHKPDGTDPYEDYLTGQSENDRVWFYQLLARARKEMRPHAEWREADLADLRVKLEQECHPGTQQWHDTFSRISMLLSGEASSFFGPLYAWNGRRVSPSELCTVAVACRIALEKLLMGCEMVADPTCPTPASIERNMAILCHPIAEARKALGIHTEIVSAEVPE